MKKEIRFSDGKESDTTGPLRKVLHADGWYIIGNGLLIPMKDEEEANEYIDRHS